MRIRSVLFCLLTGAGAASFAASAELPSDRPPPFEPQWSAFEARLEATEAARGVDPDAWLDSLQRRSEASGRSIDELFGDVRMPEAEPAGPPDERAWAPRVGVPILRVGDDLFCDFTASSTSNGLQQAIDAALADGAGETEIRVANTGNYLNRRYFINDTGDQSVTIIGGFPTCGNMTASETTVLDRGTASAGPVIQIESVAATQLVTLENLELRGGNASTGGALEVRNNNFVLMTDVRLTASQATLGGGMAVIDLVDGTTTTVWMLGESRINGNSASSRGGGIYCFGTDAGIALDAGVAVQGNTAMTGGGLAIRGGCQVAAFSSLPAGIFSNSASDDGGGVWIDGASQFRLLGGTGGFGFGDATVQATLDVNQATDQGGGIYAEDAGTLVRTTDAWISTNQAASGGGVYLRDGAQLQMDRTLAGSACHDELRCSRLAFNEASGGGGGIFATGDAPRVDLRQTWIEDNRSTGTGMAVRMSGVAGARAELFIEGAIVSGNAPVGATGAFRSLFDLQTQTDAIVAYTSAFDNLAGDFVNVFSGTNNVDLQFHSSLFSEPVGGLARLAWGSVGNTGDADCLLVWNSDARNELPPSATQVSIGAPALDANGLLTGASPAVDYCDNAVYSALEPDILGTSRGVDTAGVINGIGPFDLGAHEFTGTVNGGTISISPPLVEAAEGSGDVLFSLRRSGGSEGEARVRVFTIAGTAAGGADFVELDQTVVWSDGDSLPKLVAVPLIDDGVAEPAETFSVGLQRLEGTAPLGTPTSALVRIFDNEQGIFADGFEGPGSI